MNIAAAAFWISLAAVLIAGGWFASRREALKHETLRLLVEKTGTVDETALKEVYRPPGLPPNHPWLRPPPPGQGYTMLRVGGTVVMFGAAGLAAFFLLGDLPEREIGMAAAAGIALFGAGLFFSSRFVTRPARPTEQSASDR